MGMCSMLYQKVEEKIKIAGNQLRGTVKDCYPSSWEVYVPLAITEYTRFMSQYFQVLPGLAFHSFRC